MTGAPGSSGPVIRARRLCKSFGDRPAVIDVDLDVQIGEVFGVLGANGSGKSTTIRMLLDLLRPTAGEVTVFGRQPRAGGPSLRRRIGYLPGDFVIDDRQSVHDALTGLARLRGGVPAGRVAQLADQLGLDLHRRVRELSKGNRQKVGLVQAFMGDPELLILDEPTDGLDPLLREQVAAMITDVRADGRTVVLSTHILSEVQAVAGRVGILRAGRLIAVDTVEALRERAVHHVEIRFDDAVTVSEFGAVGGLGEVTVEREGKGWVLRCQLSGSADRLIKTAARHTVRTVRIQQPDLAEVVISLYREEPGPDAGR